MEWLNDSFYRLTELIEWPYLAIFILLSHMVKKHFKELLDKITGANWKPVYVVLILATLLGILYGVFVEGVSWVNLLLTYALGTSFYETILDFINKKFK